MSDPLVTVICLCYNQALYVAESIESVLKQNYQNIELIVVDDGSKDDSKIEIKKILTSHPEVVFIQHKTNLGNCRAFNTGLRIAKGEFIIDLAADDILLPTRISEGISKFREVESTYGVHFSNVNIVDEKGKIIRSHFKQDNNGNTIDEIPQGDIYVTLLSTYIISAPSMMIRKEVFNFLGGYDEHLAYEDFDFWVRSGRQFLYCYTDQVLVNKRELKSSHSTSQYGQSPLFLESTFAVCEKAFLLNKTKEEDLALRKRVGYEMRMAILSKQFDVGFQFLSLYKKLGGFGLLYAVIIQLRLDLSFVKRLLYR